MYTPFDGGKGFPGRLAILCQQVLHRTLGIGETAVPWRIASVP